MLVSPTSLFEHCYGRYAIAAINVWSLEQIHALFSAGQKSKSPFIVQLTPVAAAYGHMKMLLAMVQAASEIYPGAVFATHLDHGSAPVAMEAISSGGFTSVMIDASHESFEDNMAITREIVGLAHPESIQVEAELGVLAGIEDNMEAESTVYTRPEEVEFFVKNTACNSLAIAIGTSHGAYKFSGEQAIQFHILEEIQKRLPGFPLVLHGGSSVSSLEVERINKYGGKLKKNARGIPSGEILKAITYGITKINIATDARILWTRVHREYFSSHPEQFDPLPPGKIYMNELEELYIRKFDLLGSINKTGELKL